MTKYYRISEELLNHATAFGMGKRDYMNQTDERDEVTKSVNQLLALHDAGPIKPMTDYEIRQAFESTHKIKESERSEAPGLFYEDEFLNNGYLGWKAAFDYMNGKQ